MSIALQSARNPTRPQRQVTSTSPSQTEAAHSGPVPTQLTPVVVGPQAEPGGHRSSARSPPKHSAMSLPEQLRGVLPPMQSGCMQPAEDGSVMHTFPAPSLPQSTRYILVASQVTCVLPSHVSHDEGLASGSTSIPRHRAKPSHVGSALAMHAVTAASVPGFSDTIVMHLARSGSIDAPHAASRMQARSALPSDGWLLHPGRAIPASARRDDKDAR